MATEKPKPKSIEMTSLSLHQPVNWATVAGGDSKTLNNTKIKGLRMFKLPEGYVLFANGKILFLETTTVASATPREGLYKLDDFT